MDETPPKRKRNRPWIRKCAIKNCWTEPGSKKRMFRFPKASDDRVMLWKLACNDPDIMKQDANDLNRSARVCSDHFEPKYMETFQLDKTAHPTLNLFLEPRVVRNKPGFVDRETQTAQTYHNVRVLRHVKTQTMKTEPYTDEPETVFEENEIQVKSQSPLSIHEEEVEHLESQIGDVEQISEEIIDNSQTQSKNFDKLLEQNIMSHLGTQTSGQLNQSGLLLIPLICTNTIQNFGLRTTNTEPTPENIKNSQAQAKNSEKVMKKNMSHIQTQTTPLIDPSRKLKSLVQRQEKKIKDLQKMNQHLQECLDAVKRNQELDDYLYNFVKEMS